ncbi:o-succinylbenzoate--CoA ligase [Lapillicoccus sp.]|uniref:o-succinylbenzoate--CoA ligase n=1 Tax=Lapillicoccus sp. TaxID=1909287 RepID=UPI0025CFDCC2|nr:o-succinylbenzoate--CoA ligase [Lapillicoccus sp.]
MTAPQALAIGAGRRAAAVMAPLEVALGGSAPVAPYAAEGPAPHLASDTHLPDRLALVVGTSGSTGMAKRALLTVDNLVASATATHEVLGGVGSWLLAMPATHIAGIQVLVRSLVAGTTPEFLDIEDGFTAGGFVDATGALRQRAPGRCYTALVPTQMTRLLDDPAGVAALAAYDGVLVGGAATPETVLAAARAAGICLVRTYGMSETAGGCVYDGSPLPVSQVHIDNDHHVVLGGATVAHGYLGQPGLTADVFTVDADGTRWFRTDDLGEFGEDGLLRITGRADDFINTGGLKVAPGAVEDAIVRYVPGVRDAVVVGSSHPVWGEAVSAALTLQHGAPVLTLPEVRECLRGLLPDHALPRRVLIVDGIPQRGPGKPDRRALVAAFEAQAEDETMEPGPGRRS